MTEPLIYNNDSTVLIGVSNDHIDTITSVIIPDGVALIADDAFRGCPSLQSVVIPDSIAEIEPFAFSDCTSLTTVRIKASNPGDIVLGKETFNGVNTDDCTLYVPNGAVGKYRSHPVFGLFKNIKAMGAGN